MEKGISSIGQEAELVAESFEYGGGLSTELVRALVPKEGEGEKEYLERANKMLSSPKKAHLISGEIRDFFSKISYSENFDPNELYYFLVFAFTKTKPNEQNEYVGKYAETVKNPEKIRRAIVNNIKFISVINQISLGTKYDSIPMIDSWYAIPKEVRDNFQ
ncbi:hypothetical protein COT12_01245 [Candidatus Berkelbacteria bacterium CG08_land_8_20_14_0_20_39_8]|uniref:Uncharacterized protein n=1 Tax=Candidatus Berkelbacteria bacterium CG08_land_8_20_14_0_20_39_8 TaxID=1974511 RepID=A0A2M6YCI5_9BACT|nr:MAG: hypothetical protein COT12_01245 [Candidatus Berkelbacteria bacterium CG08_land_8_20_14_0_20_39_8]